MQVDCPALDDRLEEVALDELHRQDEGERRDPDLPSPRRQTRRGRRRDRRRTRRGRERTPRGRRGPRARTRAARPGARAPIPISDASIAAMSAVPRTKPVRARAHARRPARSIAGWFSLEKRRRVRRPELGPSRRTKYSIATASTSAGQESGAGLRRRRRGSRMHRARNRRARTRDPPSRASDRLNGSPSRSCRRCRSRRRVERRRELVVLRHDGRRDDRRAARPRTRARRPGRAAAAGRSIRRRIITSEGRQCRGASSARPGRQDDDADVPQQREHGEQDAQRQAEQPPGPTRCPLQVLGPLAEASPAGSRSAATHRRTSSLAGSDEDDLPELLARLEPLVRGAGLREREHRVDVDPRSSRADEVVGAEEVLRVPIVEPSTVELLPPEPVQLRRRVRPARRAADDDAAARLHRPERPLPRRLADVSRRRRRRPPCLLRRRDDVAAVRG